jgi:serine/threonine-protein kinase
MNLTAGTALHDDKYLLNTQLGKGVFGITYRATNTESGETVVIKTIGEELRQHSDFDQFKQQFLELAERLRCCKHPNLVQVLDCFEDAGRPYLVMEYIPGQTLAELIQANVLPEAKAIEYIRQISAALSVLHKAGLLHRDVKPQNIIRRQDTDRVVLGEFGITCEFTPGVMQTHASLSSPGYAPLEQYSPEGQRTPATDIYALAATLYCLLTGRPPLPAPVRKALYSQGSVSTEPPQEHNLFSLDLHPGTPNLSSAVKQVIWRGLELTAQRRPQTVEAWLTLLPRQERIAKPQPALTQRPAAKPRVANGVTPRQVSGQADLKPALTNGKILQPTPQEKKPTPEPALAQHLVKQPKTQDAIHQDAKNRVTTKLKQAKARLPLRALFMTGAIAASAGLGFGFALRINGPNEPGSTLLHTQQSFPPSSNWPMSKPQL